VTRILDSHLHVWDLSASAYAWLGPQHGTLHRSFLPAEAAATLETAGVDGGILVQAEDSEEDTRFMLDAMAEHPVFVGVVGWVRLDDPEQAERQLATYGDALCGIRHLVHDDPRDDFLELPTVRTALAEVARRKLVLDVPDAWPRHLDAVARLASALPELVVVVDHLGKPPRGGGADELAAWQRSVRSVAARPNTVAKVSGLQTPRAPYTVDALRPVVDVALDAFGPDRLMYGGDWPMTTVDGDYGVVLAVTRDLVSSLTADEQLAVWSGTATRVYGGGAGD